MKRSGIILTILLVFVSLVAPAEFPSPTNYDLQMQIFPNDEKLAAQCGVTLVNYTDHTCDSIPMLLYRLLDVTDVKNQNGRSIRYSQRIARMAELPACQVNAIWIFPDNPLVAGDSLSLIIDYRGYIYGYPEIMQYTRDHIGNDYTLVRNDVFSYPIFSDTIWANLRDIYSVEFPFTATVKVPNGYTVASGGILIGRDLSEDSVSYKFRSKAPVWRIDLAAAPFAQLDDANSNLHVYYLPDDSIGATYILKSMHDVISYYSERFGPAPGFAGYTVIEIPDGWGSQAGKSYILQAGAAFKDSARINEVYHEVGHSWNAKPDQSIQRCRFFDEAFASFFESISLGHFKGDSAHISDMEANRKYFIRRTERDSMGLTTPIAKYGEHELGGFSYTKGAWSLYVLNQLIGDDAFNQLIRTMLIEYTDKSIDFHSFKKLAENVSKRKLDKYFDEWIFGNESTSLLLNNEPIDSIVNRYR